jgi:predicted permease
VTWWNRLRRRGNADAQTDKELRFHLDQYADDLIAHGHDPEDARREAWIALGGLEQVKENCRDVQRWRLVEDLVGDLRFAARWLCKSPAFTITVITLLALGIGANTAIFSLANAILLRVIPVREPDRLVLFFLNKPDGASRYMIPQNRYRQLLETNTVLEGYAAATFPPMSLSGDGNAERVNGLLVSGTFFETLGLDAALGRVLTPADDRVAGSPAVCVIGYGLWQRQFGKDPGIIGRKIRVNSQPFIVVGVTPREFFGLSEDAPLDVSIPLRAAGMSEFASYPVRTFGRLKKDVSVRAAQASLDLLYRQFETPSSSSKPSEERVELRPGRQGFSGLRKEYQKPLLLLMSVVGLVLLIACANITNLLMARSSGRAREIAVRLAIGAGRTRLVRQLLAENALLTISGAILGVALAYGIDRALLALAPRQKFGGELVIDVNPDCRVLVFTLAVVVLVTLLCGIVPAIHSSRLDPASALKGAVGLRSARRISFAHVLVVAQVALSLVLLIGAGLFLRSLYNLKSVDAGLNADHLVLLTMDPGLAGYSKATSNQFAERLVERARRIPGVVAASTGFISPFSGGFAITSMSVPGYQPRPGDPDSFAVNWIGPDYFKVLETPLLAGRTFTERDGRTNQVAIVNEKISQHFWPNQNPIGKHAMIGRAESEIVGVVKDVKSESLRQEAQATVYLPFPQNSRPHLVLHVRVAGGTAPVISSLLREIPALDPNVAPYEITTMAAQLDRTMMLDRLMAALTTLFGLLAAVLAAVGLYGVMAFVVAVRTREIGIRMALGADYRRVLGEVMREGGVLIAIGIALGVPAAWWASRAAASFLYGLSATDPATYVLFALSLAAIALSAAWIPARRAALVDPVIALRQE